MSGKNSHKPAARVRCMKWIDALAKDWRAQADFIESCKLGAEETRIVKAMRTCADELEQRAGRR